MAGVAFTHLFLFYQCRHQRHLQGFPGTCGPSGSWVGQYSRIHPLRSRCLRWPQSGTQTDQLRRFGKQRNWFLKCELFYMIHVSESKNSEYTSKTNKITTQNSEFRHSLFFKTCTKTYRKHWRINNTCFLYKHFYFNYSKWKQTLCSYTLFNVNFSEYYCWLILNKWQISTSL